MPSVSWLNEFTSGFFSSLRLCQIRQSFLFDCQLADDITNYKKGNWASGSILVAYGVRGRFYSSKTYFGVFREFCPAGGIVKKSFLQTYARYMYNHIYM